MLFRGVSAIHKRDRDKRGYRCPRERVFIIQRCMWFIRKIRTGIKAFLTIRYTWGETNSIRNRTSQHLKTDSNVREDWKDFADRLQSDASSAWQYVIADGHFNKSMTLDVENKLMHYLLGSEAVKNLNNRRANAQGDYYTKSEFDRFFRIFGLGFITGSGVIPLRGDHS